jgi:hypothetical protein
MSAAPTAGSILSTSDPAVSDLVVLMGLVCLALLVEDCIDLQPYQVAAGAGVLCDHRLLGSEQQKKSEERINLH